MTDDPKPNERLIFRAELLAKVGLSYTSVWNHMRSGTFPRSVVVGGRVAWLQSEIEDWIRKLPRQRLLGDPDPNTEEEGKNNG